MYIDAHNHLDLYKDIEIAIEEINKYKIYTLAMSMDIDTYKKAKEYSKKSEFIIPCFGIHPWCAKEYNGSLSELIPFINESLIIGEIGLDFYWEEDKSTYNKQIEIFEYILKESVKRNKIINIHTKGAEKEILDILKKYNYGNVIVHWYSGNIEWLKEYIKLGCYFTISVDIGYNDNVYEILDNIPMDKLLTETDGPTALEWVNGEYSHPNYIKAVLYNIAKYKEIKVDILRKIVNDNYFKLISKIK